MEGKKGKRGRGKTTAGHGRVAEKKKKTQVMNDKEEQDRLEAASVLSTLMFLPPKSSGGSGKNSPVNSEPNGILSTTSTVTYISAAPSAGIPTQGLQLQGTQSLTGGSGAEKVAISAANATPSLATAHNNRVIIAQLQNQINCILKNGQTPPQIQLMMPLQAMQVQALKNAPKSPYLSKRTSVPNIVMHAEPPKLPITLNPGQTVNKDVASALRQAVTSTNKKQLVVTDHPTVKSKNLSSTKPCKENGIETSRTSLASSNLLSSSVTDSELSSVTIKKENSDNTLPLKKRRLIAIGQNNENSTREVHSKVEPTDFSQDISSSRFSDLTTATQMENILQMARDYSGSKDFPNTTSMISNSLESKMTEGYRPVQIDPRTSLMILSDVKLALTQDQDGDLPIHIAVVHENLQLVTKLIDIMAMTGKSVDRYNKLHQTPLHLSILVNQPQIVAALLVAGANPNLVDRHGRTSLHIAIAKRFPECLRTLYTYARDFSKVDIRLSTKNYDGYPPLHTCIELDDISALKFLILNGANVDIQDGKAGRSALFYAVEYNRVRMVEYLLSHRATADLPNYASVTPLMVAQSGNMKEVLNLLQKALDLTKVSEEPEPPTTRKVPIPRIPSKASMIITEAASRSRSNSIDRQSPSIRGRQRSMSSCSSPIDLSVHRNTESPRENSSGKEKGDKVIPGMNNNNVKEKHTQLVAALEGRRAQSQGQAQVTSSNTDKTSKLESVISQQAKNILALARAQKMMANKHRGNGESMVSSSSDVKSEKLEEKNVGGVNIVSEGVADGVNDSRMDTDSSGLVASEDSAEVSVETQEEISENEPGVVISIPEDKNYVSIRIESPEEMEVTESQSLTNSPASVSKSPEMPVLSRMQSFTNDQESVATSLDLPEMDQEEVEMDNDTVSDKDNTGPTSVVTHTQRSQESLSSSQGFETVNIFTPKQNALDMEGDASLDSTQKSDVSDESVEIDSSAVVKARLAINHTHVIDKDKNEKEEGTCNYSEANDKESVMDIDEDDDEKPLVIDEGPIDNKSDVVEEETSNTDSKANERVSNSCTEGQEHSKTNIIHTEDTKLKTDVNMDKTFVNKDKTIDVNKKEDKVEVDSTRPKMHSSPESEASKAPTDVSETINTSVSEIIPNKETRVIKTDERTITSSFIGKTPQGSDNSITTDSKVNSSEKPDVKKTTEPEEPNLSSVDHLLKEGKSHTLFYHDGEGYKPIKIFIDNSEQSSLVLQRMLQANFASLPPHQTDKTNQSKTNTSGKSSATESDDKTYPKHNNDFNKKEIPVVSKDKPEKLVDERPHDSNKDKKVKEVKGYSAKHPKDSLSKVNSGGKHAVSSQRELKSAKDKKDTTRKTSDDSKVKPHVASNSKNKLLDKLGFNASQKAQIEDLKNLLAARDAKQTFQMAYINSLKQGTLAKTIAEKQSSVTTSKPFEAFPKKVIDSSEPKSESTGSKRSAEIAFAEGFLAATKTLSNLNTDSIARNENNQSLKGDVKPYNSNSSEVITKLPSRLDSIPQSKCSVSSEAGVSIPGASVSSSVSAVSSSGLDNISQKHSHNLPVLKHPGFHAGRGTLSEGTLTRINPDIKSKLSMALQSPQRKLSKTNTITIIDTDSKLVTSQSFESAPKLTGFESVSSHSITDSRQQL